MRRFYAPELLHESTSVELRGEELRHIKRVLRLKTGSEVELFNGLGLVCTGKITEVEKSYAVVEVAEFFKVDINESPVEVVLLQGLAKGTKPEFIIQKATELGVAKVGFFTSAYSVPDVTDRRAGAKLVRWARVAVEAAKQCRRSVVPEIDMYNSLQEALQSFTIDTKSKGLIFNAPSVDEAPASTKSTKTTTKNNMLDASTVPEDLPQEGTVKEVFASFADCKRVFVVIGPEGGFAPQEIAAAKGCGLIPVSLGARVLRTETAAVTVLSIVQYELGGLD